MPRVTVRATSIEALLAELHREDLLREAARRRGVPSSSIGDELRRLARAVAGRRTRLPYAASRPRRAVACTD